MINAVHTREQNYVIVHIDFDDVSCIDHRVLEYICHTATTQQSQHAHNSNHPEKKKKKTHRS